MEPGGAGGGGGMTPPPIPGGGGGGGGKGSPSGFFINPAGTGSFVGDVQPYRSCSSN